MDARTPTSLPKGMTMADYDVEVNQHPTWGTASKAPQDLKDVMEKIFAGNNVIKLPDSRSQTGFMESIRVYLRRRGKKVQICRIGDDELWVKLLGE